MKTGCGTDSLDCSHLKILASHDLTIIKLTAEEPELAITTNEISDAKTLSGFLLWKLKSNTIIP